MKSIKAITIALTLLLSGAVFAANQNKDSQEPKKEQEPQLVTINLTDKGYEPSSFKLQKDVPAKITFVRKSKTTCGTEIVISEYDIKRDLPLNEPVVVEFTPTKAGQFSFACGMNMLSGKIVVLEKAAAK